MATHNIALMQCTKCLNLLKYVELIIHLDSIGGQIQGKSFKMDENTVNKIVQLLVNIKGQF